MNDPIPQHLTAEELDALLVGGGTARAMSHLATCPSCAALRELDGRVVAALTALPAFDPAADFSDRVMARVSIRPATSALPLGRTVRERSARRRVIAASIAGGGAFAAGLAWAVANPAAALDWTAPTVTGAGTTLWITLQTIVANAAEQPWFGSVRDALGSPTRAFPVLLGVLGSYALALVGLRRLLTERTTDAGW